MSQTGLKFRFMNTITTKLVDELLILLPDKIEIHDYTLVDSETRNTLIYYDGDINVTYLSYKFTNHYLFVNEQFNSVYLENEDDADEFKQMVLDYYEYEPPEETVETLKPIQLALDVIDSELELITVLDNICDMYRKHRPHDYIYTNVHTDILCSKATLEKIREEYNE